jgi:hypothetical protein
MASYGFNLEALRYKPMVDLIQGYTIQTESKVAPAMSD